MAAINARSFLRGYTLWKSDTPVVNRAPCSLQTWARLPQESQGIQSSAPSRLRREPSGTPCQGKASLSHTPCKSKAGHKRSFSAHSHCGGRCLARFSFVGTAVALTNAPLRPRRRAAPRSARSLAPSTPTRLHARVSQAAKPPLRFAPGCAVSALFGFGFPGYSVALPLGSKRLRGCSLA